MTAANPTQAIAHAALTQYGQYPLRSALRLAVALLLVLLAAACTPEHCAEQEQEMRERLAAQADLIAQLEAAAAAGDTAAGQHHWGRLSWHHSDQLGEVLYYREACDSDTAQQLAAEFFAAYDTAAAVAGDCITGPFWACDDPL